MKKLIIISLVIVAVLVECAVWTSWVHAADKQDLIEAFKQLPIAEAMKKDPNGYPECNHKVYNMIK